MLQLQEEIIQPRGSADLVSINCFCFFPLHFPVLVDILLTTTLKVFSSHRNAAPNGEERRQIEGELKSLESGIYFTRVLYFFSLIFFFLFSVLKINIPLK